MNNGLLINIKRKILLVKKRARMDAPFLEDFVFRVNVDSLQSYFNFDTKRRVDLKKLDKLVRESAPGLKRYFHRGTPPDEPGMRFKMIGYGRFQYRSRSGQSVEWPVVGVALQKNYVSVYLSIAKDGVPLLQSYSGKLGEVRSGRNNFSFEKFEDLVTPVVSSLFSEAGKIFSACTDDQAIAASIIVPRRPISKK